MSIAIWEDRLGLLLPGKDVSGDCASDAIAEVATEDG